VAHWNAWTCDMSILNILSLPSEPQLKQWEILIETKNDFFFKKSHTDLSEPRETYSVCPKVSKLKSFSDFLKSKSDFDNFCTCKRIFVVDKPHSWVVATSP